LGQHFLHNPRVINQIIAAVAPNPGETIIEIGPGRGALTGKLLAQAGTVVAVEFDKNLVSTLGRKFTSQTNFKLIQADALTTDFCFEILPARQARLVANLPYNISTKILQRLIDQRSCLTEMILMLQREVVERITAPPGSAKRGYLSVLIEAYAATEKLFDVSPNAFQPVPKVWSGVIRVIPRSSVGLEVKDEELLKQLVSAGFAKRRKTILNNLRGAPTNLQERIKQHGGASIILCEANVSLQRRAETLSLAEWGRITNVLE